LASGVSAWSAARRGYADVRHGTGGGPERAGARPAARAELLTQASRAVLAEMVALIFARLEEMPETSLTPTTARSMAAAHALSPAPSEEQPAAPLLAGPGGPRGFWPCQLCPHP